MYTVYNTHTHIYIICTRPINKQWRNLFFLYTTSAAPHIFYILYLCCRYDYLVHSYLYRIYLYVCNAMYRYKSRRHYITHTSSQQSVSCSVTDILPLPVTIGRSHQSTVSWKKKSPHDKRRTALMPLPLVSRKYIIIILYFIFFFYRTCNATVLTVPL